MKEKLELLVAFLKGQAAVTSVMGSGNNCRLYPFVAPAGVTIPFMIYSGGSRPVSKDGREDTALISLYFEYAQFSAMSQLTDSLTTGLNMQFEVGEIETGYSEKYDTIVTNINLTI